jgi:hypothetical protein
MRLRPRHSFFVIALALLAASTLTADPVPGQIYAVSMVDIDQNKRASADGHVSVFVIGRTTDAERMRTVGDRVPEFCLGDPLYRMITLLRFERVHQAPMRGVINAIVRRRLDAEAQRLQLRYRAKNITRDARRDVSAVTDFDGAIGAGLGLSAGDSAFRVLVFGRKGELIRSWTAVPSPEELAATLKQAR